MINRNLLQHSNQSDQLQLKQLKQIGLTTAKPLSHFKHLQMSSAQKKRVSCPLSLVFAVGCVAVVAAFTAVTALSGVLFSSTMKTSVDSTVELALRGAFDHVLQPLQESERYVERLRDKIETEPAAYALDDEYPNSIPANPSLKGFFIDGMLASIQRPEMLYIFQVRQSSRYFHSPGNPVDMTMVSSGVDMQFLYLTNNTWVQIDLPSKSDIANFTSLPESVSDVNISGTPYIQVAYDTPDKRWVIAAFSIPSAGVATSTLMTIYAKVKHSGSERWAVGIDHNMASFRELMLQATPPFSLGVTNPDKVVVDGSHTSLYDLHGGAFVTSSLRGVTLFKSDTELWPAGQTPSEDLNSAYRTAISVCQTTDCLVPVVHRDGKRLINILRYTDASTSLDMLLVGSVPRSYFFQEADTSLYISIAVAVCCCALVVAGCVALMMCIRPTLQRLQENMILASELQNDRVEHTDSFLSDIAELSSVFDDMNQRLLIARSFVPEAVLLGQRGDSLEDDADGVEDEGTLQLQRSSVVSSATESARGSIHTAKSTGSRVKTRGAAASGIQRHVGDDTHTNNASTPSGSALSSERIGRLFVMAEKRVSILALNLTGFNGLVFGNGHNSRPQRIFDVSTQLITIVVRQAQKERGVMDSFHGDHFILTFNASRAVAGSLGAAVRTAGNIEHEIRKDNLLSASVGVSAGAASGKAFVGTLGIDGYRRMSVVGPVFRMAVALEGVGAQFIYRTAPMWRNHPAAPASGCVVDETALKEIVNCGMYVQLIGVAQHASGMTGSTSRVYGAHYHGNAAAASVNDDEWLYELDQIQAGDPYKESNVAMESLVSGDLETCNRLVEEAITARDTHRRRSSTVDADLAGSQSLPSMPHSWALVEHFSKGTLLVSESAKRNTDNNNALGGSVVSSGRPLWEYTLA